MPYLIKDYYDTIKGLPLKASYKKEELMIPELLIEEQEQIALYYCTHNQHINECAKVFIVGITPGFNQMNKSIAAARLCIEENVPLEAMPYLCKREARFEGSLRKNIISMLDELGLANKLGIEHAAALFEERDDLLHTTSMIPFAAFVKGKNYTGHQPPLLKSDLLRKYVETFFYQQVDLLKDALIIPLGKSVEEILKLLINEGKLKEENCLLGFPHPSGANAHRYEQFANHKAEMIKKINKKNF